MAQKLAFASAKSGHQPKILMYLYPQYKDIKVLNYKYKFSSHATLPWFDFEAKRGTKTAFLNCLFTTSHVLLS